MKLFISIGENNNLQLERLRKILPSEIVIVENYLQADIFLLTNWEDKYFTTKIKAVFIPYTGKNRFPLDEFASKKIDVYNTHAKSKLVAERAFSMTLAVLGKLMTYDHALRHEGKWLTRDNWGNEFWKSLHDKRCGIVGMGHIGRNLLAYLKPFNCEIINLERDRLKGLANSYVSNIRELIRSSDIIYLCCPQTNDTVNLVNMTHLDLLDNKVIINVSRGKILEEEVLYKGLKDGKLYGAGIDVWYQYPVGGPRYPSKYDLSEFNNLLMSPHASCHVEEFKNDYYDDIFSKIIDYSNDNC